MVVQENTQICPFTLKVLYLYPLIPLNISIRTFSNQMFDCFLLRLRAKIRFQFLNFKVIESKELSGKAAILRYPPIAQIKSRLNHLSHEFFLWWFDISNS